MIDKIRRMSRNQKKLLMSGILCLLLVVGITSLRYTVATPESMGNMTFRDQVVSGLSIEGASIESKGGITTFTAEVYNDTNEVYNLKTISIEVSDEEGSKTTLIGYIGESLEIDEARYLKASIDKDVIDPITVKYVINQ